MELEYKVQIKLTENNFIYHSQKRQFQGHNVTTQTIPPSRNFRQVIIAQPLLLLKTLCNTRLEFLHGTVTSIFMKKQFQIISGSNAFFSKLLGLE